MTTTEKYFKALGWKRRTNTENDYPSCPIMNSHGMYVSGYPNITQSYPDFKKWVLEKMEGEGWWPELTMYNFSDTGMRLDF